MIEVAGSSPDDKTVLFYGHYDKQPHMTGWNEGLSATKPVVVDDKLYGRGKLLLPQSYSKNKICPISKGKVYWNDIFFFVFQVELTMATAFTDLLPLSRSAKNKAYPIQDVSSS